MEPSFDSLESSLSFEDSLLHSSNIDNLYHTYLGSMDTFPAAYSGSENYSTGQLNLQCQSLHDRTARQRGAHLETFQNVSVSDWRGEECAAWASSVCRRRGLDQNAVDLCSFRTLSGSLVLQFSLQDFCSLVGDDVGRLFYKDLRAQVKRQGADYLEDQGEGNSSIFSADSNAAQDDDSWTYTKDDFQALDNYILEDTWDPQSDSLQDLDLQEQFVPIKYERGPKSWEFLVRLLADSRTNPSVIRWEDEVDATFRLTQPDSIARMWGARSGKPSLSYVNFARGLRYHYNTGALEAVSERQLVYRCGPKALQYLKQLKQEGL
ncbi:ETS-related transcription factor Elf-5-like isoform X3 [Penaeus chinensis]|uniref:ETS-related transcription factor Elf-5-like isoform X3 n=1 Tax=Penaeus chinensis TaxID=139456 RepID=UPI001FB6AFB1|nr:ETS-related transcription factor Elf-5-like isoform X3 [Penaeus chinensis]